MTGRIRAPAVVPALAVLLLVAGAAALGMLSSPAPASLPVPSSASTAAAVAGTATDAPECVIDEEISADPYGVVIDYQYVGSLDELTAQSALVVSGTVDHLQVGPRTSFMGVSGRLTWVVVLRDVRVVTGEEPAGGDGHLYLEVEGFAALEVVFAPGTALVGYLQPVPPGSGTGDSAVTRSERQPLYRWANSHQGAIVQPAGCDRVWWPYTGDTAEGTLAQTLPGGTLFSAGRPAVPDLRADAAFEICAGPARNLALQFAPTGEAGLLGWFPSTDLTVAWWADAGYPPSETVWSAPVGAGLAAVCSFSGDFDLTGTEFAAGSATGDRIRIRVVVSEAGVASLAGAGPDIDLEDADEDRPPIG